MNRNSKFGIKALAAAVVVAVIATGCSTTPLRTEASTSGISAAEAVGAADVPQAALYLQLAKEGLERARSLAAKNDHEEAASMLLRAEADAELAVMLSHEDAEKAEALAAIERVRKLRQSRR